MKNFKYTIDLFWKNECNHELAAVEFSKALDIPKKLFMGHSPSITLRYKVDEEEIANIHCTQLNQEILVNGFNHVEFRIRESKVL